MLVLSRLAFITIAELGMRRILQGYGKLYHEEQPRTCQPLPFRGLRKLPKFVDDSLSETTTNRRSPRSSPLPRPIHPPENDIPGLGIEKVN